MKIYRSTLLKTKEKKMKITHFIVFVIFASLILSGCAGNKAIQESANDCIPAWFLVVPTADDAIYGTGQAEKSSAALGQKAADTRAFQAISEQMVAKVQSFVKDYLAEAGVADNSEVTELTSNVVKVISKSTLTGARIKERKPCGNTWYSLSEYKISAASSQITDTLKNEAKKKEALYNKIEAKISFDEMEKEIEKSFGND